MDAKTGATGRISYEEFEPFCKWQREEARDTLILHLPEFKKDQLRVHITNRGILKISGERKVDATKTSKFYKEVVVPKNCNTNAIQAKFANNQLYITMPKDISAAAVPEQNVKTLDPNAKPEASQGQARQPQELGKEKDSVSAGEKTDSRGKQLGKIALNVAMPVALLAALVAFVLYMYKSTIVED